MYLVSFPVFACQNICMPLQCTLLASNYHIFLIGLKSGERARNFQTLRFLSWENDLVTFDVPIFLKNNFIELDFVMQG